MIDSSELLRKFSNIIGIPMTEARLGLEIFTQQIAQKFSFGDQIVVKSLGYFSYRKIKSDASSSDNYQPVVLFSNSGTLQNDKDVLIFFLPNKPRQEFPHIDSHLNLSFAKPLIAIKPTNDNKLLMPSSGNELLGLIESKIEKLISEATIHPSAGVNDVEFIISSKEEEVLTDTNKEDELKSTTEDKEHEEQKNLRVFDDFELVKTDESESADELIDEDQENAKWFFDDAEIQNDLKGVEETLQNTEGFIEVRDPLPESMYSEDKNVDYHLIENEKSKSVEKPKKSFLKKLVFSILAIIIIGSASVGVYFNYDNAKLLFAKYFGNQSEVAAVNKKNTPSVIERTFEIAIASPYDKEYSFPIMTPDSMIISPAVFRMKQVSIDNSTNENEFAKDFEMNTRDLIKVGGNIYKKDSEFIVQVSSWKSKSKAEEELKKYTEIGFRTTLIEESSSDLGKYHRVMVGGFTSLDEAKNFLNKNK